MLTLVNCQTSYYRVITSLKYIILQNELLTCLWYLNLRYTLRDLGAIQKFNNNNNDNEDQYRYQ